MGCEADAFMVTAVSAHCFHLLHSVTNGQDDLISFSLPTMSLAFKPKVKLVSFLYKDILWGQEEGQIDIVEIGCLVLGVNREKAKL